jgi:membrane protein implicated in regulation of membrane protease activity
MRDHQTYAGRGTWVRYLRNPRVWFGVPAVVVGVVVGLLTNIVTTTPTWPVVVGLVTAVVVWVVLTTWQAAREEKDREKDRLTALRAARDELLEPMQPALQGTHTIST